MPSPSWKKSPAELVERFAAALPDHAAIVRKPMFGYPAAFANGNMICGVFRDSVVVLDGLCIGSRGRSTRRQGAGGVVQEALDFTLTLPKKPAKSRLRPHR